MPPNNTRHRYLTKAATTAHVLYPFGYGLSYSNWTTKVVAASPPFRNRNDGGQGDASRKDLHTDVRGSAAISISAASLLGGTNVTLTVSVLNQAGPAGSRVSYAFLIRADAPVAEQWPMQWLPVNGFSKVHEVAPGTTTTAVLSISARDLSRWNEASKDYSVKTGQYSINIRDCDDPPVVLHVT
jgi:beta-glucosidase